MNKCFVVGAAMGQFAKPGRQAPFREMAAEAIKAALKDADIGPEKIEQAYASFVYGDSTSGQHALYDVIQSGIPVINVNNNCSSGSAALFLARQAVRSGAAECVLAFGFEEMSPGALGSQWDDRESPFIRFNKILDEQNYPDGPLALRCFGAAGSYYLEKYDAKPELFARIAAKSRSHAKHNPNALFTAPITHEEVTSSPVLYLDYLTRLMCCPPTCGAAAAVIASESFAKKHGLDRTVEIAGQAMTTDTVRSWADPISLVGADMTSRAATAAYEQASCDPAQIDVVELHDCFTTNEAISYEGLGLCANGEATRFVHDGDNTYGGKMVVNPSGGLMSKGHPLGATGLAQCFELTTQLRGAAGARQVDGAKTGLQHNIGLGGAAVVTIYQKHAA